MCLPPQVLLGVAKEAPTAFLEHLQALVNSINSLWDQGLLREGEKSSLYEGLMAAASAGGLELQRQLLEWVLRRVHAKWTDATWLATLDSPEAFAREYLQFEVQADGSVVIGSRCGCG